MTNLIPHLTHIEGRKVALGSLVGSHNYNLNTEKSDVDVKYFVFPTFDDLYSGKYFTASTQSETEDKTVHDIRRLQELLYKSNVNFLEICFSKEIYGDPAIVQFVTTYAEDFARGHLKALYFCMQGAFQSKRAGLYKGTATTAPDVEKYGYDAKNLHHMLRLAEICHNYQMKDFRNFAGSLYFSDTCLARENLIAIKNYDIIFCKEDIDGFISLWENHAGFGKEDTHPVRQKYLERGVVNTDLYADFNSLIKGCVKNNL